MRSTTLLVAILLVAPLAPIAGAGQTPAPSTDWSIDRPGDAHPPGTIVPLEGHGDIAAAMAAGDRVDGLRADGSLAWSTAGLPEDGLAMAAAELTGDGAEDVLVANAAGLFGDAVVTALDGATGQTLWRTESFTGSGQVNELLLHDTGQGSLVLTAAMPTLGSGGVEALDPATGASVFTHSVDAPVTSLAALGERVYAGTGDGRVIVLDTSSGDRLDAVTLVEDEVVRDIETVDASTATRLVTVAGQDAVGVDADGKVTWTRSLAPTKAWSLAVGDGDGDGAVEAYVNTYEGDHVHALDAGTGSLEWAAGDGGDRSTLPFTSPRSIVLHDVTGDEAPEVLAAGLSRDLRAYAAEDGDEVWGQRLPGPVDWLAPVDEGRTLVVQRTWFAGGLTATGQWAWTHDLGPYEAGLEVDWNGDGTPDPVVSTPGHAYVHDGETGDELLRVETWPHIPSGVTTNVDAGELTGDETPDLVVTIRNPSIEGVTLAYDGATGELLWSVDIQHVLGAPNDGLWLSDVTLDGTPDVFVASNAGFPSEIVAIDGATGEELWTYAVEDTVLAMAMPDAAAGPPTIVMVRDHTSCACHDAPALIGLDAVLGVERWIQPLEERARALTTLETPLGQPDLVATFDATSGDGPLPVVPGEMPRRAIVVHEATTGVRVHTVDPGEAADDARLGLDLWSADVDGDGVEEIVHTLRTDGRRGGGERLAAVDPLDGELAWTSMQRAGGVFPVDATPASDDGSVDLVAHWSGSDGVGETVRVDGADGSALWTVVDRERPTWYLGATESEDGTPRVYIGQGTVLDGRSG